jgi:hypothetical protein
MPRVGASWIYIKATDFSNSSTANSFPVMLSTAEADLGQFKCKLEIL